MPVAAADSQAFQTVEATGDGLQAIGAGTLQLGVASAASPALMVTGLTGSLLVVDEYSPESWRFPLDPEADIPSIYGEPRRSEVSHDLQDFSLNLEAVLDGDAVALVLGGPGFSPALTVDNRYQIRQIADEVIEHSHTLESADPQFQTWRYYEYRSGDRVELSTEGGAHAIGAGDFQVYFWGQTLSYTEADGQGTVATGYTRGPSQEPAGATGFVMEEHTRYAILTVTDGTLSYVQDGGPLRLLADRIEGEPAGPVSFVDARGTLATETGSLSSDGGIVQAEGGAYAWTRSGGALAVDVIDAPSTAQGTNAVFVEGPGQRAPRGLVAAGAATAAVLLAAAYLYPSLRGARTVPTGSGWASRRADGYASMASTAETHGLPRLAAFWMSWSLRAVPADPLRMVDLAILRAQCGRHSEALRLHEAAHGWLADAARGDHVAHNAYEAAKSAAVLGRGSQALDWMRMALEADPGLVQRVSREPAFATLRDSPDYASLTVGGA